MNLKTENIYNKIPSRIITSLAKIIMIILMKKVRKCGLFCLKLKYILFKFYSKNKFGCLSFKSFFYLFWSLTAAIIPDTGNVIGNNNPSITAAA